MKLRMAALACVALAASTVAQTTWTVDAAGGGDFTKVQDAVEAAAPNDILRILPGDYAGAVLDKRLRLLGDTTLEGTLPPRLFYLGVDGADSFTLVNLRIGRLVVEGTSLRSEIDRCKLGPAMPAAASCEISFAQDVLISRSTILGAIVEQLNMGSAALFITSSNVQLVDSLVRGADLYANTKIGWGGSAALLAGTTHLLVAGSQLIGGFGQSFLIHAGRGGHAILVHEDVKPGLVHVDVRGNLGHELRGGLGNVTESTGGLDGEVFAFAQFCNEASLVHDGVTLFGIGNCITQLLEARPRLSLVGAGGPGAPLSLESYGSENAAGLLALSLMPAKLSTPLITTTPLYLNPGGVFLIHPLVLHGSLIAAALPLVQPEDAALVGLRVHAQCFQASTTGTFTGSNAQTIPLAY